MKECKRHSWRVGSFIGYFIGKQIRKKGINIWCENCNKKIKAYYKPKWCRIDKNNAQGDKDAK